MRFFQLSAAAYGTALVYCALLPSPGIPSLTGSPWEMSVWHFIAYLAYGLLLDRALGRGRLAALTGLGMGLFTEALQLLVPTRHPDMADLAADFLGILAGVALAQRIPKRFLNWR